jgi:hypothetical protein
MGKCRIHAAVLLLCFAVVAAQDARAEEPKVGRANQSQFDQKTQRQIDAILRAKSTGQLDTAYEELFEEKRSSQICELKNHPNLGIALSASWEEVRREVSFWFWQSEVAVDRKQLKDFLAFAEKQLKVKIPTWWKESVQGAKARSGSHVCLGLPFDVESVYARQQEFLQRLSHGMTLKECGKGAILTLSEKSVVLRDEQIQEKIKSSACVCASLDASRAYLAFHSDFLYGYPLDCFDRKTGKRMWQSDVWTSSRIFLYSGADHSNGVTISSDGERALVFGADAHGAYVEGFRAADGLPLFRFSTRP